MKVILHHLEASTSMVVGFALQSIQVSGGQEHNMRLGQSAFLLVLCSCRNKRRIYWSIKWRIVLILESNITSSWSFYIHGGRICPTKHSSIRWSVIELHITSHFRTQNTIFFITSSLIILSSLIFKPRKERENMEGNRQTSKSRNLSSLSTMIHQGLLGRALSQVS